MFFILIVLLFTVFSLKEFIPNTFCIHPKEGIIHLEKEHPKTFCEKDEVHVKVLSEIKNLKVQLDLDKSFSFTSPFRISLSFVVLKKQNALPEKSPRRESPIKTVRLLI